MKAQTTITYLTGRTQEVRILPIDLIRVEREGKFGEAEQGLRLLHSAASRNGESGDFDSWAATVVEIDGQADAVDPTGSEVGDGT